jgi:hypothetical protein
MSEETSLVSEWFKYAPLLLTIAGWWIVNGQNNKREARKEHRALVDGVKRQVLELSVQSLKYLKDTESDLAPSIKWSFDALEVEFTRIPEYATATSNMMLHFVAFSDACTGGTFEQANRESLDFASPEAQQIISTRNQLLETMESWFFQTYCIHRSWWY